MHLLEVIKLSEKIFVTESVRTEPQCPKMDVAKCFSKIQYQLLQIRELNKKKKKKKKKKLFFQNKWAMPMHQSGCYRDIVRIVGIAHAIKSISTVRSLWKRSDILSF